MSLGWRRRAGADVAHPETPRGQRHRANGDAKPRGRRWREKTAREEDRARRRPREKTAREEDHARKRPREKTTAREDDRASTRKETAQVETAQSCGVRDWQSRLRGLRCWGREPGRRGRHRVLVIRHKAVVREPGTEPDQVFSEPPAHERTPSELKAKAKLQLPRSAPWS